MARLDRLLRHVANRIPFGPGPRNRLLKTIKAAKAELRRYIQKLDKLEREVRKLGPKPPRR